MGDDNNESFKKKSTKQFVVRNSLFTDILENQFRHNLLWLFFIFYSIYSYGPRYMKTGSIKPILDVFSVAFNNFPIVIQTWLYCFLANCLAFFGFKLWAQNRTKTGLWDWFWVSLLLLYYFYSFKLTSSVLFFYKINLASAQIITMESTRLLMKFHSFVRTVAPTVISSTQQEFICPSFSQYIYFSFAPTLIYRDSYPKTKQINWNFIYLKIAEFLCCLLMLNLIILNLKDQVKDFGLRPYKLSEIIIIIFENIVNIFFMTCVIIYMNLDLFHNVFGELLQFGDRLFYKDWWNRTALGKFLADYNTLVNEWLYYFIYLDFYNYICKNKVLGKFVVFFISFVVHEWGLYFIIGSFCPILFFIAIFIFLPSILIQKDGPIFNILNWVFGVFLASIFWFVLSAEHYALYNLTHSGNETFWDYFIPKIITSECFLLE